jgi:diaminopimelate epimerase
MLLNFSKMHGCGNDYVYVNCMEKALPNPGAVSKYVSPRHMGIVSDGLILICPSDKADFKMRMFNADASEGKMCGNGIRCVAKYVYDRGLTDKKEIKIETLSGIKDITVTVVDGKVTEASVDMGCPIFRTTEVPMISDHYIFVDQGLVLKDTDEEKVVFNGTSISMGNPHFVTFVEDIDKLDLPVLGPQFEHHKLFPEGVNTEFVQVVDSNTVKFRVWERGSGETLACGTGASAVTAATIMLSRAGKKGTPLNVITKGGPLKITYRDDEHIIMQGPATHVFDGTIEIPESIFATK